MLDWVTRDVESRTRSQGAESRRGGPSHKLGPPAFLGNPSHSHRPSETGTFERSNGACTFSSLVASTSRSVVGRVDAGHVNESVSGQDLCPGDGSMNDPLRIGAVATGAPRWSSTVAPMIRGTSVFEPLNAESGALRSKVVSTVTASPARCTERTEIRSPCISSAAGRAELIPTSRCSDSATV